MNYNVSTVGRRKLRKKVDYTAFLPIASLVIFWFGVLIYLFAPSGGPEILYPTTVDNADLSKFQVIEQIIDNTAESVFKPISNNTESGDVLFEKLVGNINSRDGDFSLYIKDLSEDKLYEMNEDLSYYGASLYKIPTAVAVLKQIEKGELEFTDTVKYQESDYEGGSGALYTNDFGTEFTIETLLRELIRSSDNVAQNMLIRKLGYSITYEVINYHLDSTGQSQFIDKNVTSALEIGQLLEEILARDYLDPQSKKYLFDLMSDTLFDDRISVHLSPGLSFSHKIGNWPNSSSWHDCGIVFNESYEGLYVVCLMSRNTTFEDFMSSGKDTAEFINALENLK